jgi:hypothetical protein
MANLVVSFMRLVRRARSGLNSLVSRPTPVLFNTTSRDQASVLQADEQPMLAAGIADSTGGGDQIRREYHEALCVRPLAGGWRILG